nr:immunoglobulin heavy chain junction region [Macaca mulatta]MOV49178.1 immunoglobulin heavy chain junction region [Macaca mulatta]MOV49339.1 immunoglobulin heavy chain junction region [Macaca mulatta]MOV49350.1 immunoglobulin heavy chain junction region [Macaca mulatta]MOV49461.1 immunoglobulin heavy chain junction region [Macaca mulatta]
CTRDQAYCRSPSCSYGRFDVW